MNFNLTYDTDVPLSARNAIASVSSFFSATYNDDATVNIWIGWGELTGTISQSAVVASDVSYAQIKSALTADAKSADDAIAVGSLFSSDPIGGSHTWSMPTAQQKALGLLSGIAPALDGFVTFDQSVNFDFDRSDGITSTEYDFAGLVAHEFSVVMGRALNSFGSNISVGVGYRVMDLFKYSAPGSHVINGTTAGYLSFDAGTTNLADFNTDPNALFGDWGSISGDAFSAFFTPGALSPVSQLDVRLVDVLGWDLPNHAPVASIGDHSLQTNQWSRVTSWISYSDADSNPATKYEFYDGGTDPASGYFWTPDNPHHAAGAQITVAAADLDNLWIRGGQVQGQETIWFRAFDGTDWSGWDIFGLTTL